MCSRFTRAISVTLVLMLGACSTFEPLITRIKVEVCPITLVKTQCPVVNSIEDGVEETIRGVLISREQAVKAAIQCHAGVVKWEESYSGCKDRK